MPARLLPFLGVVALLTVTPGPDMALVLRNGIRQGSRTAWWTGLGCCAGIAVHATAAVVGLSALLVASAEAFTAVKLVGAAYLVYLGAASIWHARRATTSATPHTAPDDAPPVPDEMPTATAFRQGFTSNILNPKIALLFLTLLPQFVARGERVVPTTAALSIVFLGIAVLWWRIFSLGVGAIGRVLSEERVRRNLERATGAVLIALGLRVAFSE